MRNLKDNNKKHIMGNAVLCVSLVLFMIICVAICVVKSNTVVNENGDNIDYSNAWENTTDNIEKIRKEKESEREKDKKKIEYKKKYTVDLYKVTYKGEWEFGTTPYEQMVINEDDIELVASSMDELAEYISERLSKQAECVVVRYSGNDKKDYLDELKVYYDYDYRTDDECGFYRRITRIDRKDNLNDGMIIQFHTSGYEYSALSAFEKFGIIVMKVDWYNTRDEVKRCDEKIAKAIDDMNIDNASDYEKMKAIYDYVIDNIEYDYTYSKYTEYDGLFGDNTCVCQGFAALIKKMTEYAGIDSKIITAYNPSHDTGHTWNIVKIDNKWYHLDATWDACMEKGKNSGNYKSFLKCWDDFSHQDQRLLSGNFEPSKDNPVGAYPSLMDCDFAKISYMGE